MADTPLRSQESSSDDSPNLPDGPKAARRRNVRTACTACKRRKLKCSGQVPCQNCDKNGSTCTIDEATDQRRKQVLKRKMETLEGKGELLDRLFMVMQEADAVCAAQTMNLIRSHASLDEIRAYVDDLLDRSRLEKTPELLDVCNDFHRLQESEQKSARPKLERKQLSDIVLFRVPARPWTTVSIDDDFVSHLISLWFTWSHPFLNWIDRDLFLRDMQSGDLESTFCSPFLVNIILADACAYSDYPEAYGVAAEQWSRGIHFYKEAKRHLDREDGRVTLANVQGLGVLYVCSCMMGKDRSGWIYHSQLTYAVQELCHKPKPPMDTEEDRAQWERAVENAIWGLFNLASMTALAYQKVAQIQVPRRSYSPLANCDLHRDKWTHYPLSPEGIKSHCGCLVKALCDISQITYDLSWLLFGDKDRKLDTAFAQATEDAHSRLNRWYQELPKCLGTRNAPPHVLSLHLKYHTIIQTIFGFVKGLPKAEDENSNTLQKTRQKARELCLAAAQENAHLIDLYRDLWSLDYMPPVNIHWVTVSMFTLLESLDDPSNHEAFVSLSIAAKAFSHRWPLGKGMLRLIQVTSKQMSVTLPPETDALFSYFEMRLWKSRDRMAFSSQYPNFAHSMKHGNVEDVELDLFLEKFDDLHLASDRETSEERSDEQQNNGISAGLEVGSVETEALFSHSLD